MIKRIILVFSIFILLLSISFIFKLNYGIEFNLKGKNYLELEVNKKYIEKGFKADLLGYDISKYVNTTNNINTKKLGEYNIKYSLKFLGYNNQLTRTINIIDTEKPTIELVGDNNIYIYEGEEYIEYGVNIIDNYDTNLNDKLKVESNLNRNKAGEYKIKYSVKDSSNNKTSLTRNIIVKKKEKPIISNPISNYILSNNYDISFGYYNLVNGKSYFYNENKVYFAASLIKTVEALYLYDNNKVTDELKPYIEKAISVSDNDAHHYLQNIIGKNNLKQYGESLGAKYTLSGGGVCGNTTVKDQLIFLKRLYEITKNNNEELKSWFMNDYGNYLVIDNNMKVMHKYGYYTNVFHDVGIVLDKEPYIIIILTGITNNYKNIINELSKITYEYHLNN